MKNDFASYRSFAFQLSKSVCMRLIATLWTVALSSSALAAPPGDEDPTTTPEQRPEPPPWPGRPPAPPPVLFPVREYLLMVDPSAWPSDFVAVGAPSWVAIPGNPAADQMYLPNVRRGCGSAASGTTQARGYLAFWSASNMTTYHGAFQAQAMSASARSAFEALHWDIDLGHGSSALRPIALVLERGHGLPLTGITFTAGGRTSPIRVWTEEEEREIDMSWAHAPRDSDFWVRVSLDPAARTITYSFLYVEYLPDGSEREVHRPNAAVLPLMVSRSDLSAPLMVSVMSETGRECVDWNQLRLEGMSISAGWRRSVRL
jgi:hypothetical protein